MKSSSISLLYVPGAGGTLAGTSDEDKAEQGHLVNLIDSPGHVDFCSEARTHSLLGLSASSRVYVVGYGVCGTGFRARQALVQSFPGF